MILNAISSGAGATALPNVNGTSLLNSLAPPREDAPTFTASRVIREPRDVQMNRRSYDPFAARSVIDPRLPWHCVEGLREGKRMLQLIPPPCPEHPDKVKEKEAAPAEPEKMCTQRQIRQWGTELRVTNVIVPCDPPKKKGWCDIG